jgi:hypothetical protein
MVKPDFARAIKRHGFPLYLDAASFNRIGRQDKPPPLAAVFPRPREVTRHAKTG